MCGAGALQHSTTTVWHSSARQTFYTASSGCALAPALLRARALVFCSALSRRRCACARTLAFINGMHRWTDIAGPLLTSFLSIPAKPLHFPYTNSLLWATCFQNGWHTNLYLQTTVRRPLAIPTVSWAALRRAGRSIPVARQSPAVRQTTIVGCVIRARWKNVLWKADTAYAP